MFERSFLERASGQADALPFHHAHKKVAFVDAEGTSVKPTENNATKFERFIFDLLPSAKNAIVCEVDPADGFCAVKNGSARSFGNAAAREGWNRRVAHAVASGSGHDGGRRREGRD